MNNNVNALTGRKYEDKTNASTAKQTREIKNKLVKQMLVSLLGRERHLVGSNTKVLPPHSRCFFFLFFKALWFEKSYLGIGDELL